MNRINFEEDNRELIDDVQNSEYVMDVSMSLIHEILIEPNEDKLTAEESRILATIGQAFKLMASKARAHELMEEMGGQHPDSVN
jgi:hypothetical protein